ncbi:hypothetical protein PVAG01_06191 [Phlyctema vagabunda]|uniref:Uncharacterized protein n=1 Tax=Phlyctema vagabunda TaxID=108571 RepID=A0ABR4PFD9_9HELO
MGLVNAASSVRSLQPCHERSTAIQLAERLGRVLSQRRGNLYFSCNTVLAHDGTLGSLRLSDQIAHAEWTYGWQPAILVFSESAADSTLKCMTDDYMTGISASLAQVESPVGIDTGRVKSSSWFSQERLIKARSRCGPGSYSCAGKPEPPPKPKPQPIEPGYGK